MRKIVVVNQRVISEDQDYNSLDIAVWVPVPEAKQPKFVKAADWSSQVPDVTPEELSDLRAGKYEEGYFEDLRWPVLREKNIWLDEAGAEIAEPVQPTDQEIMLKQEVPDETNPISIKDITTYLPAYYDMIAESVQSAPDPVEIFLDENDNWQGI